MRAARGICSAGGFVLWELVRTVRLLIAGALDYDQGMTDGKSDWLIEHRRTTRDNAKWILINLAFIVPTFAVVPYFILMGSPEDSFRFSFACCWYEILAVVTPLLSYVAWLDWKADGEFVCRLSAEWLECQCPVKECGESYRLPVSEIDGLESEDSGDKWHVLDKAGRRYRLNPNYGNPVLTFVQKLRELRPELRD